MRTTIMLAIATTVAYVLCEPMDGALWPVHHENFRIWQFLTHAFMHGSWLHLLVNMIALVSFGPALEQAWGRTRFLSCYVLAAMIGGALQVSVSGVPIVGASAALFGLFAAYVVAKPHARVLTLWPAPVAAWKVLTVYTLLTVAAWVFGWATGIAHAAHLAGMIVGLTFAINNKPRR